MKTHRNIARLSGTQEVDGFIPGQDIKIILKKEGKVLKRSDTVREGTVSDVDFGDWLLMEGKVEQETYDAKQAEAKKQKNGALVKELKAEIQRVNVEKKKAQKAAKAEKNNR